MNCCGILQARRLPKHLLNDLEKLLAENLRYKNSEGDASHMASTKQKRHENRN